MGILRAFVCILLSVAAFFAHYVPREIESIDIAPVIFYNLVLNIDFSKSFLARKVHFRVDR